METLIDHVLRTGLEVHQVWSSYEEMNHQYMTCRLHPTTLYVTKNPHSRSLHFVRRAVEANWNEWPNGECPCDFALMLVLPDGDPKRNPEVEWPDVAKRGAEDDKLEKHDG